MLPNISAREIYLQINQHQFPHPAQPSPAQQCECLQPVLSVDARLTVHRQTQRVMTR